MYRVLAGECLSEIGAKLGVKWLDIANANGIKAPYVVYPGEGLVIPGKDNGNDPYRSYTVHPGDCLSVIGQKLGVNYLDIAAENGLQPPYVLHPGQVLKIKGGESVQLEQGTIGASAYNGTWANYINASAQKYGVDPWLIAAVITQESGFNQGAISPASAIGAMQLMPGTARDLGVNPYDLGSNIDGGTKYLAQLLKDFNGNVPEALAGYNWGEGHAAIRNYPNMSGWPGETQNYVKSIMANYSKHNTGAGK